MLPSAIPAVITAPIRAIVKLYVPMTIEDLLPAITIEIKGSIDPKTPFNKAITRTTDNNPFAFLLV
ncbi:hypothetical protein SDC49_22180 [Lactobacillus sp. R2/2]|nr:hypothetical protein [Lactobacillus sp. R2/2]